MTKKKRSYFRFYAIAKAKGIDLDRYKETLVLQFTDGRTSVSYTHLTLPTT